MLPDDPRHGTSRGYTMGCREDCCRRAQMIYMKRYRMGQRPRLVDPTGTRRRIQALVCLGYSHKQLSEMAGRASEWTRQLMSGTAVVSTTADIVADIYERLSMTPATHPYADRCRRQALDKGWLPPLAWDDIDDPTERPTRGNDRPLKNDVDPVVVHRFLTGDHKVPTTQGEKRAITAAWVGQGRTVRDLEASSGWNVSRYLNLEDGAA